MYKKHPILAFLIFCYIVTMLTVIITYKGELDNLKHFVDEMFSSGTVDNIRKEEGNMFHKISKF